MRLAIALWILLVTLVAIAGGVGPDIDVVVDDPRGPVARVEVRLIAQTPRACPCPDAVAYDASGASLAHGNIPCQCPAATKMWHEQLSTCGAQRVLVKALTDARGHASVPRVAGATALIVTTGVGEVYPVNIQHEVSANDGIADPVPGITVYGVTEGVFRELRQSVWQSPKDASRREFVSFTNPEVPVWRRWSCHPTLNTGQCEFTIQETMSSTIFSCSQLLEDGWKPGASQKDRQPTPKESLWGYWYLP